MTEFCLAHPIVVTFLALISMDYVYHVFRMRFVIRLIEKASNGSELAKETLDEMAKKKKGETKP